MNSTLPAEKTSGPRPGRRPPAFNALGFGLFLYGRRDPDPAAGSLVRTLYLCVMFLPVFALRAYRVGPDGEGWAVLGRERVSWAARVFSVLTLLIVFAVAARAYTTTPGYLARRTLAEADRLAASGRIADAAASYAAVAVGPTDQYEEAVGRLSALIERPDTRRDLVGLGGVFRAAVEVEKAGRWRASTESLYREGATLARGSAASDPQGALAILDALSPVAPTGEDLDGERRGLLEKVVAANPTDAGWATRLALAEESRNHLDRAEAVLTPVRDRLEGSEGARLLGQIDARAGRLAQAIPLLKSYIEPRLARLAQAEKRLQEAYGLFQKRTLERLQQSRQSDFDYEGYARSDAAGKTKRLSQYLESHVKGDPQARQAEADLKAESRVVPVVLELGMALFLRAQGEPDPAARKASLDEAEAAFLKVGGVAGHRPEYQLNLGRVYYWQGKYREGRAALDLFLKEHHHDPELTLMVASLLRDVGSLSEARQLAEDAYGRATDPKLKQSGAVLRGLLGQDDVDSILWLRQSGDQGPNVGALLAGKLASQAMEEGDRAAAIEHLNRAISLTESLPDSDGKMENNALYLMGLSQLTGDRMVTARAASTLEKVLALDPASGLATSNALRALTDQIEGDVIGEAIDLPLLQRGAGPDLWDYLADDTAGLDALAQRLKGHPSYGRALGLMERANLLTPRNPNTYSVALRWLAFRRDTEGLRVLQERVQQADLDTADIDRRLRGMFSGDEDAREVRRWKATHEQAGAVLAKARARGGPTFAVAVDQVLAARVGLTRLGEAVDHDDTVKLAEEAVTTAPSLGSRKNLRTALIERAAARTARVDAGFARLRDQFRRSSTSTEIIALGVSTDGRLKDVFRQDPDFARAADLMSQAYGACPVYASDGSWWALLKVGHPEVADAMARTELSSEWKRWQSTIQASLLPVSPGPVLAFYWWACMRGDEAGARSILEEARRRKIPVPVAPPAGP